MHSDRRTPYSTPRNDGRWRGVRAKAPGPGFSSFLRVTILVFSAAEKSQDSGDVRVYFTARDAPLFPPR